MSTRNKLSMLLIGLMLVLAVVSTGCDSRATPVPTAVPVVHTATPIAMLDINAVLTKYISSLPDGFGGIAPATLKDQMTAAKPFLLDVREVSETTTNGYTEGGVVIPIRGLAKNLDKLPAKDQPIVIHCASGHRGSLALETLQLLGYTNVKSLSGGFNVWKGANLPIATFSAN